MCLPHKSGIPLKLGDQEIDPGLILTAVNTSYCHIIREKLTAAKEHAVVLPGASHAALPTSIPC